MRAARPGATAAAGRGRVWPRALAALVVLGALVFLLQPALLAVAAPGPAPAPVNPVRVRVTPAADALGGGTLRPGEPRYHPVRVHNDGAAAFRYDLTVAATGNLARLITVEFRLADGGCDAVAFAGGGQAVAGPDTMAELVRQGGRTLPPGASELLCARVELPAHAPMPSGVPVADAVLRITAVQA